MQILNVTYRDVEKTDALDALVHEKAEKLDEVCDHIMGCHIAIEQDHKNPSSGSPYRVRIDLTVPPGHELAVDKSPNEGVQYQPLESVIRDAFDAARRQLAELVERQRNEVKVHPQQVVAAIVTRIFPEEGYGFIKTLEGQEVYFHQNSVLHDDFDRIEVGTGVQFFVEEGEKGPQATTVRVIDKPGSRVNKAEQEEIEPPLGWQE